MLQVGPRDKEQRHKHQAPRPSIVLPPAWGALAVFKSALPALPSRLEVDGAQGDVYTRATGNDVCGGCSPECLPLPHPLPVSAARRPVPAAWERWRCAAAAHRIRLSLRRVPQVFRAADSAAAAATTALIFIVAVVAAELPFRPVLRLHPPPATATSPSLIAVVVHVGDGAAVVIVASAVI